MCHAVCFVTAPKQNFSPRTRVFTPEIAYSIRVLLRFELFKKPLNFRHSFKDI